MNTISMERLKEYLRGFDEYYEAYPEHPYEGEAIFKWVLECGLSDGIISKDFFEKNKILELKW